MIVNGREAALFAAVVSVLFAFALVLGVGSLAALPILGAVFAP